MAIATFIIGLLIPDTTKALIATTNNEIGQNIYIVLIINLIIWAGIFFFLLSLDQKIKRLNERIQSLFDK